MYINAYVYVYVHIWTHVICICICGLQLITNTLLRLAVLLLVLLLLLLMMLTITSIIGNANTCSCSAHNQIFGLATIVCLANAHPLLVRPCASHLFGPRASHPCNYHYRRLLLVAHGCFGLLMAAHGCYIIWRRICWSKLPLNTLYTVPLNSR